MTRTSAQAFLYLQASVIGTLCNFFSRFAFSEWFSFGVSVVLANYVGMIIVFCLSYKRAFGVSKATVPMVLRFALVAHVGLVVVWPVSTGLFSLIQWLLPQLLSGALAGRPSWVYYPDGLKKLMAHDENSQVSYLETLRVYLDNNLSVTKTAAALYLHRSTLLDRLAHITQLLGCDLKNPDFCLTLGILLRAELQQKRIAQPRT